MNRHPYTYAADSLRQFCNEGRLGSCTLSRAEASKIRQHIAKVLGISDAELAIKLSEDYQRNMEV